MLPSEGEISFAEQLFADAGQRAEFREVADQVIANLRQYREVETEIHALRDQQTAGGVQSSPPSLSSLQEQRDKLQNELHEARQRLFPLMDALHVHVTGQEKENSESQQQLSDDELYRMKDSVFRFTVLAWDVQWMAKPGDEVEEGQVLAVLRNPDLEAAVVSLEGQMRELDAELSVLWKQQRFDESAGLRGNELEEQRDAMRRILHERKDELYRLVVRAPVAGVVLPVVDKPDREPPDGQLPGWVGSPLEAKNRDAYLAPNDRICQIGNPEKDESGNEKRDKDGNLKIELVAEIIIDQVDVEMVRAAMTQRRRDSLLDVPVDLMLDALPGKTFDSRIETVALAEMTETPIGLSTHAGGDVNSVADTETGMPKPLSTSYPAVAALPDTGGAVQLGMRGKAKIYTGWQPLGRRLYRLMTRTFHFEL